MQDSKLVVERTKEWQQLVSKMAEAYFTTNGIPSPAKSVGDADMAFPPKGKRSSWANKYNKWIGVLRLLEQKHKNKFLGKTVCPESLIC